MSVCIMLSSEREVRYVLILKFMSLCINECFICVSRRVTICFVVGHKNSGTLWTREKKKLWYHVEQQSNHSYVTADYPMVY